MPASNPAIEPSLPASFESELTILEVSTSKNPQIELILHSINTYLIRNKGAAADFNLIKDIVERNTEGLDREINLMLPIPLYIGLAMTMFGIILGLWNINIDATGEGALEGIGSLITGVRSAMFASFAGLFLTTFGSWFYRKAKSQIETRKNHLYTFIQTELLPILTQDVNASLDTLQRNLLRFNEGFGENVQQLKSSVKSVSKGINDQALVLKTVDKLDVARLSKANVEMFLELKKSMTALERFGSYLHQMNSFVDNTQDLNRSLHTMLDKFRQFENDSGSIAQRITRNLDEQNQLVGYLNAHTTEVVQRSEHIREFIQKLDIWFKDALKEIKGSIQSEVEAIRDLSQREELLIAEAYAKYRPAFQELERLQKVEQSLHEIQTKFPKEVGKMSQELASIKETSKKTMELMAVTQNQAVSKNVIIFHQIKQGLEIAAYSSIIIYGIVQVLWYFFA